MKHDRVPVPVAVLKGIDAVRLSGKSNMFDVPVVIGLASQMGYFDTAKWISERRGLYVKGVLCGFSSAIDPADPSSDVAGGEREGGGNGQCADN